jgi:hypothetical protein
MPKELALTAPIAAVAIAFLPAAEAQETAAPAPPAGDQAAPAAPDSAPKPEAPAAPSPDETVKKLEARVADLEKQATEKASKLKLSGYLQGRYEWHDDANFGLDPAKGTPRGSSRFLVRRARIKATYAGKNSEFMMQVSGARDELTFTDAEASLVDTWTPLGLKLTMGQFKVPFGFEIMQSSSERELPERARMYTTLYPGERDRGLRLTGKRGVFNFAVALINGNGTLDAVYRSFDQTSWKDLVGRLQMDLSFLAVAISGHWGHTLKTRPGTPASGGAPAIPTTYERFNRVRVGADVQGRIAIRPIGDLVLRAEVAMAKDTAIEFSEVAGDPCSNVKSFGWSATAVQHVHNVLGVVARVDQFDPNGGLGATCKGYATSATDRVLTVGGGVFAPLSENIRLTLAYDHVVEQAGVEVDNDVLFAQIQTKF